MADGRNAFYSTPNHLIVIVSDGTVATSSVAAHTASGSDEPVGEDVAVVLAVGVDEEEHVGEAKLGGAVGVISSLIPENPGHETYTSRTPYAMISESTEILLTPSLSAQTIG